MGDLSKKRGRTGRTNEVVEEMLDRLLALHDEREKPVSSRDDPEEYQRNEIRSASFRKEKDRKEIRLTERRSTERERAASLLRLR